MLFEEKLAQFSKGEELPFEMLGEADFPSIARSSPRFLTNVIFEAGVSLSSSCITPPGEIFIGAHSYMGAGGLVRKGVMIGRYCSLGRRISLAGARHRMDAASTFPSLYRAAGRPYTEEERQTLGIKEKPARGERTVIGHDVWVGDGAVIMSGVTIGMGAIVGANAVVTRDIPPYGIAVGVPAKVIRSRFPEEIVRRLIDSKYWELPMDLLKSMPVGNVFDFLDACADQDVASFAGFHKSYRLAPKPPVEVGEA
jgi:acetyltransferase-like isoleucine patch superfamily enzyme